MFFLNQKQQKWKCQYESPFPLTHVTYRETAMGHVGHVTKHCQVSTAVITDLLELEQLQQMKSQAGSQNHKVHQKIHWYTV